MSSKKGAAKATTKKAAAPAAKQQAKADAFPESMIEKRPRDFGIGGNIQPVRDLTRFVKWPKYVRIQRQRKILHQRLKSPPAINQFTKTLDKKNATALFRLLDAHRPEEAKMKKQRLQSEAAAKKEGKTVTSKKPTVVKMGINHVASLIEEKKAQLVIIAHDVDPLELVIWLPTLCKKRGIPYCIVKGKARLGKVVHKKNATCLALTDVRPESMGDLKNLANVCKEQYNDNYEHTMRQWGDRVMGSKFRKDVKPSAAATKA